MITANKSELYSVKLDEAGERVFNMLLRSYTGLFADFVYINESVIARRADVDEQKVYETMLQLSRMHILQYVLARALLIYITLHHASCQSISICPEASMRSSTSALRSALKQ